MFRLGDAYLTIGINFILVLLTPDCLYFRIYGGNRMQIYFQKNPTDKNQITTKPLVLRYLYLRVRGFYLNENSKNHSLYSAEH